jgi:hypothetical protein
LRGDEARQQIRRKVGWTVVDGVDAEVVCAALDPDELADPPGKTCPAVSSVARPLKGWVLISDCS